jgi:hypothetical protein
VLRSSSAGTWGGTTILGTTTALSYTNVGGAAGPGLVFYNVD